MALPKKFRFTSKFKINSLFLNAKRRGYPLFSLLSNTNNDLKLAVLVSKKIDKRSTERNALKRKFNLTLGKLLKKYHFNPMNIIFLPKKQAIIKKQTELEMEIKKALEKEGIINVKKAIT